MGMFDFMAGQARTPTWDEVQRRRALADALAGSIGAPTTLGEGLSSIGAALGGVLANRKADRMDAARAVEADNVFEAALAGVPQDNSPLAAALGGTFAAPTNAPPAVADALTPVKPAYGIAPGAAGGAVSPTFDLSSVAVGGATRPDSFTGMHDDFRMGLASMIAAAPEEVRSGIKISSGYRSPERQQQLWNDALRKYGSAEAARKWVAPPGRSNHNHGKAADIKFTTDAAREWAHANAAQYNLAFPLSNEPWHIELASARGGNAPAPVAAAAPGPTAAAPAMPGFAPISIPAPPPVNVAMIRAMNNPYLSPEQRQILGSIMAQQQANQITPYQMAQLQMAQQDQAMQAAKFGLEMQQAMQPKPVQWDTREVNGGVVQVNPMTGETRQVVAPVPKGPDFRPATAEEAARYGAQAGQFGPDGRFYPNNPPSGLAIETGPDGQVRVVQGAGAQGAAGKPFTEAQSKDNIYATRAEGALATLDPISGALPDRGAILADKVPLGMARGVQSDQYQVARAAADEFLQAILRKDTGAAITAQEQELYGKTYLPQPGDSEAAMAQKQQARRRAVEALKSGMSPAQIIAQEKALQASGSPSLLPVAPAAPPMSGDAGGIKWKVLD